MDIQGDNESQNEDMEIRMREEGDDNEEEIQNGTIVVRVYLPYEIGYPKKYAYTYEIMNMTGGYVQYLTGICNVNSTYP